MSGHLAVIPSRAVTDARITPAALRVLLAIGSYTNTAGWCRVKQETIAELLGASQQAVSKQVRLLAILGYVEVVRTGRSSRYRVVLDVPTDAPIQPDVVSDNPPIQPDVVSETTSDVVSETTSGGCSYRTTSSNDVPQRESKSLRSPAAKASRLPDQFFVSAEMQEWASREVPFVDWKAETAKFCDHWRSESGQRSRKLDWVAAWRNWLRRSAERSTNGRTGHGRPVGIDAVAEYARQKGMLA